MHDLLSATEFVDSIKEERGACINFLQELHSLESGGKKEIPWEPAAELLYKNDMVGFLDPYLRSQPDFWGDEQLQKAVNEIGNRIRYYEQSHGIKVVDQAESALSGDGRAWISLDTDVANVLKQSPECRQNSRLAQLKHWVHHQTGQMQKLIEQTLAANGILSAPADPSQMDHWMNYTSVYDRLIHDPFMSTAEFRALMENAVEGLESNVQRFLQGLEPNGELYDYSLDNLKFLSRGGALREWAEGDQTL